MICLYCKKEVVKNGLYGKGIQRYKCLNCNKTFSDVTIDNYNTQRNRRLVLHLVLAGCTKLEIAEELSIEEKTIKKWVKAYLKGVKEILPLNSLLAIRTLVTIYTAIEKSRISKMNINTGRKRFRHY